MNGFLSNSPFAGSNPELSTKTKETEFYLPSLYLNEEEVQEENKRFSEFIDNTVEAREYTKNSTLDDKERLQVQTYYENKEDFWKSATKASTNKINEVLAGWRLDREDEPVMSITVAGPEVTLFQPKKLANSDWQFVDEFTFAGGSTFGALLDAEASTPQFTELSGRNAQANHYAAIRARGGKQGELWSRAIQNSTWLQGMLTETDSVKQALDGWIESTPTAFNVKASIPLSAYLGDTILDVLEDSPKPEGWTTEQAIKELKEADPGLAAFIFGDMQVKEERLKELAKTPLQFKYFIGDAIDTFAYQSFLAEYTKKAGFFEEAYSIYAWPLIRDSINSNDALSEVMITGGAIALTATGVGAFVGIPLLVGKGTEKIYKTVKGAAKTFDIIESVARRSGQIAKVNQVIWKTQKFLPSRLPDTVFDSWSVTKKLFKVPKDAGRLRKISTYAGKQFIGEFAQGLLESGVQQYEGMSTGFQQEFSVKDMLYNGLEEGIGGIFLGGPVKALSVGSERLMTTKLGDRINTVIDAGKTIVSTSIKVSPQVENTIDTAVRLMMGIKDGVSIQDYEGAIEQRLRLKNALIRIETTTGLKGILDADDDQNELLTAAITALSGGDPSKEFPARVEILKRITTLMDRFLEPGTNGENTSAEDVEALLFLTAIEGAGNNEVEIARINEALWLSKKRKEGVTEKDGKPLTIKDATDDELKQIAQEMQDKTNLLATKLGVDNADQIGKIFGSSLSEEDIELTNEIIEEYENDKATSGSTEKETINFGVTTEGVIKSDVDPVKQKEKQVTLATSTMMVGMLKTDDEIEFEYSSGSRAGTKRRIRVISIETNKKGEQVIKGFDLDKGEERNYLTKNITGSFTYFESKKSETTSEAKTSIPEAKTEPVPAPSTTKDSVSSIVDGLFENKDVDENIELTEEEKADLLNRVCYRKDT